MASKSITKVTDPHNRNPKISLVQPPSGKDGRSEWIIHFENNERFYVLSGDFTEAEIKKIAEILNREREIGK